MGALTVNLPEIPKSVDKACENLTNKPTLEIGTTLADIWYLVFGEISERAEKKRLQAAKDFADYKDELYAAAKAIPEERKQEPKLQIAGPALQKSQYCVEEKELREMFVNLISRSMDKNYNTKIHPSFSEIIAQMSPLDARVFNSLIISTIRPMISLEKKYLEDEGTTNIQKHITWLNFAPITLISESLDNLSRSGLVQLNDSESYTEKANYKYVRESPHFILAKAQASDKIEEGNTIVETEGIIFITDFGKSFYEVCMKK